MGNRPWADADTLRKLYVDERLSQSEIAERLGCGDSTISNWLDEHGITLPWKDGDVMRELYHGQQLSFAQIADELDCSESTVETWIERHGIETRDTPESVMLAAHDDAALSVLRDRDTLHERYVEDKQPPADIAAEIGCGTNTVRRWLRRHGIELRDQSEAAAWSYDHANDLRVLRDADALREWYHDNEKSIPTIAGEVGCEVRTVADWLEYHGIDTRSISEARSSGEPHPGYYGPDWPEQREKARDRDGYECRLCGLDDETHKDVHGQELHVHHVVPAATFDDRATANRLANLLTLCRGHHDLAERMTPLRPQKHD